MNRIKAVIFDMDGVLIDAKEWHYQAFNRSLNLFGMSISRYDHICTFDGLPTKKKLELLSQERGLPEKLHAFINEMKQQYTLEIVYAECKPIFYHQYALSQLRSNGYKLAVCSNSVRKSVCLMLERAGIVEYLDFFLSNQDVVNAKPHPEIYLKAIERLNLDPTQCLIVEDNIHGIKAAKASGAHLMKVTNVEDVTWNALKGCIAQIEANEYVVC